MLTLTVLGCSGSYPGPGQACSGYLVRSGGTTVWLDAGTGTLANLQLHVGLDQVDAIVLSHQHPDHWSDIDNFYVACKYVVQRQDVSHSRSGRPRTGFTAFKDTDRQTRSA